MGVHPRMANALGNLFLAAAVYATYRWLFRVQLVWTTLLTAVVALILGIITGGRGEGPAIICGIAVFVVPYGLLKILLRTLVRRNAHGKTIDVETPKELLPNQLPNQLAPTNAPERTRTHSKTIENTLGTPQDLSLALPPEQKVRGSNPLGRTKLHWQNHSSEVDRSTFASAAVTSLPEAYGCERYHRSIALFPHRWLDWNVRDAR